MTINKHTKKKTYKFHSNRTKSNKSISNKSNPHKNALNILSYNISWESMSGAVKSWSLCNNNTNKSNSRHSSVCVNNIASVFDNNYNLEYYKYK